MSKEYECKECTKKYTSYKSLWNHNKIYHVLKTEIKSDENRIKGANCQYCNRSFTNNFTVKRHELKCEYKNNNQINDNQINNNLDQLLEIKNKELEIVKEKNKELELKITLEKCKMHPKAFNALNKILINKSLTNSNNTNSNNTNSNNIINNNNNYYNIIGFGHENLIDVLTQNEKKQIMKSRFGCLEEIIKIAHCVNYKQFKNIIITNLKDNIAYKYDNKLKYFITIDKNEVINELIDNRVCDIGEIYTELMENNILDETISKLIKEFIEKINEDNNYKTQQNHQIRILLYNNKELITNDINLIIEQNNYQLDDE